MKYVMPIMLTHRSGTVKVMETLEEFLSFYRTSNESIGSFWSEIRQYSYRNQKVKAERGYTSPGFRNMNVQHDWIVRDGWGRLIDLHDLPKPEYTYSLWEDRRRAAEQGLPIPGTGKTRRYGYRGRCWTKKGGKLARKTAACRHRYEDGQIRDGNLHDL